ARRWPAARLRVSSRRRRWRKSRHSAALSSGSDARRYWAARAAASRAAAPPRTSVGERAKRRGVRLAVDPPTRIRTGRALDSFACRFARIAGKKIRIGFGSDVRSGSKRTVLVVDDDAGVRLLCRVQLEEANFRV